MAVSLEHTIDEARAQPDLVQVRLKDVLKEIEADSSNTFLRLYDSISPEEYIEEMKSAPLFGSLFAAKDSFGVKGFPISFGLKPPLVAQSEEDARLVGNLSGSGAYLLGSTNLDEACANYFGQNRYYGDIQNPLDRLRTPSGSSGGSAVAVARGFVDFATGSDMGGSIRAPAAACGISGIKTTAGELPVEGALRFPGFLDCPGLLARSVRDLEFIFNVIKGDAGKAALPDEVSLIVPPRIELEGAAPWVLDAFARVCQRLEEKFRLETLKKPAGFEECLKLRKPFASRSVADFFARFPEREELPEKVRAVLLNAAKISDRELLEVEEKRVVLVEKTASLLETSFILTPTLPDLPPRWEEVPSHDANPATSMGRFLALSNVCELPAVSFPAFCCDSSIPLSLQLHGRAGSDRELLRVAGALEALLELRS